MSLIDNLKWRYATKKFDTSIKVSEKDIEFLKDAVNLSASDLGVQDNGYLYNNDSRDIATGVELETTRNYRTSEEQNRP